MSAATPGAGLAALFAVLTAARNRAFDRGWLPVARLGAPVISIGNISVGGTGKTPTVIALGRALGRMGAAGISAESGGQAGRLPHDRTAGVLAESGGTAGRLAQGGLRLDVLTRGYRRTGGSRLLVLAPGAADAGAEAGDEPRLIARALGVPVLIGADRAASGQEGERRFGSQLHLLDDGFQRRQLARCFDLVLVTAPDLEDRLLPAGRLREPPRALARADAILWIEPSQAAGTGAAGRAAVQRALGRWTAAPVYFGGKQPAAPSPDLLARLQRPIFAFCALGQPESFWQTLEQMGAWVAGRRSFGDHHRYGATDLEWLQREAHAAGAEGFATTEKDAMNLPEGHGLRPLEVIGIEMRIEGLERLAAAMLAAAGLEAAVGGRGPGETAGNH